MWLPSSPLVLVLLRLHGRISDLLLLAAVAALLVQVTLKRGAMSTAFKQCTSYAQLFLQHNHYALLCPQRPLPAAS